MIDGTLAPYRFNDHVSDPDCTNNGMSLEVFNTNEMKSICRKIVNYYVKNTSGNKTVKDIIVEMQRKTGCSFDFACHELVVGTGLQRLEY